jgi:integrase
MILPKEWSWIAAAAKDAEERYGLSGTERLLVYRVAIETGLRASELQSLTRGKLHLTGANAFVLVPGSGTKNRKDAKQYISKTLAADLKRFIARKTSAAAVFGIRDRNRLSDAIRADLAAAKRLYIEAARSPDEKIEREADSFLAVRNEDGEELTFHSLRHTCGAWLAIQGEPVKLIQDVMRHSTVELTIGTYGHLLPMSYTQAAQRLGEMLDRVG